MSDLGAPIRRCPECGEEFQPHVVQCSDCGALLESAFEGQPARPEAEIAAAPAAAPRPYAAVAHALTSEMAEQAARLLTAGGIPFRLGGDASGLRVSVPLEHMAEALRILEDADVVPEQPDSSPGAVAVDGGPCPACGDYVAPGTAECAGCGLHLAGAFQCPRCGTELLMPSEACPACAPQAE